MNYEDPLKKTSDRKGVFGFVETLLRSFRRLSFLILMLPVVFAYAFCLGVSLTPAVYLFKIALELSQAESLIIQCLALAFSLSFGFLAFIFTLILVVPLINFPLLPFVKPFKSTWHSLNVIPWYYHNALVVLVRYTILELITPTPLSIMFYRLMGMKIGKGVIINTTNIQDPCLISLGDYVTIGGSATMFAHYGMKGFLILDRLHIKKGTTVGLKASVMGDVIIGENVLIQAHAVVLPKSRIANESVIKA